MPAKTPLGRIVLEVKGITIPAFKNRKRAILDRHTGKMRTLTDPSVKERMDQITLGIELELRSVIRTIGNGTWTAQQVRSWIASSLPLKDSRQWIPSLWIDAVDCNNGEDGATIDIEQI